MKLTSNVEFGKLCKSKESQFDVRMGYLEWYEKTRDNFDNFLKQPLELWMFVPCDESNNILKDPCKKNQYCADFCQGRCQEQYQEAKERVLFEGFEISIDRTAVSNMKGVIIRLHKNKTFSLSGKQIYTIEDLVKYDLNLTESAIKQIGL